VLKGTRGGSTNPMHSRAQGGLRALQRGVWLEVVGRCRGSPIDGLFRPRSRGLQPACATCRRNPDRLKPPDSGCFACRSGAWRNIGRHKVARSGAAYPCYSVHGV